MFSQFLYGPGGRNFLFNDHKHPENLRLDIICFLYFHILFNKSEI